MGEAERTHVLKRKAQTGREEHQARVMSPSRALRLAVSRAADELFDLALGVSSIQLGEAGQDGTVAAFAEDRLIMLLDGPQGAIGAVSVDLGVLAGLIEMQTMGQVTARAPDPREPTQTDAALVAPLIDAMLAGFAENLEDDPETLGWVRGFRFGARIEGPRHLGLVLEAPDFHLFRLSVDLGGGARSGEIVLALPVPEPQLDACEPGETGEARLTVAGAPCRIHLGQGALMEAAAPLTAVLHRLRLPLSRIAELQPGDTLSIPREALSDTSLDAGPAGGNIACRLGQINGFRAVRLTAPAGLAGRGGGKNGLSDTDRADLAAAGFDLGEEPSLAVLPEPDAPDLSGGDMAAGLDLPALDDLPDIGGGDGGLLDLPDIGGEGATELPDLPDLPEPADLGDLSDLPELALES